MTNRSWKAVVSIGGTVAASLPSSARKATQELERLTTAQRIDSREARKLGVELKTLRKGTQEYKTALAQQASVKTRTAERSVRIRELGERTQTSTGILSRFNGVMGRIGPYGAAAAAGIGLATAAGVGLHKIVSGVSEDARLLSMQSLVLNVDPGRLDKTSRSAAGGDGRLQSREAAGGRIFPRGASGP